MLNRAVPVKAKYQLVKADKSHMSDVISWLGSADEMLLWGGPGLIFGLDALAFAEQIKLDSVSSCSLISEKQKVIGFGQYYERLERIHFGRIGIAKDERGKGLSNVLMSLLIDCATENDNRELSLFVMKDNEPAIRCYSRLGFVVADYPESMPNGMTDVNYMVRY